HGTRRVQQRLRGCTANSQDDIGRERDQFRCVSTNALGVAGAPANFDANIAALDPARLRQRLRERQDAGLLCWIVRRKGREHANAPHPIRLLRTCRQRPCSCRTTEQRDEFPPPHGFPQGQGSRTNYSRSWSGFRPCIAAKAATHVRFGSKAEKLDLSIRCPLCPRKRTSTDATGMSA